MVRNVPAATATGLRKNRVTQKTRLRVVRGELDVDAIILDDEEEKNRVLASQGVDAEDANEHHLQVALHAANHRKHADEVPGKQSEAHIPTPDAAGLVEAYESLYPTGKFKQPTTHLRFSESVEESFEGGLAGGFTYFLDERDVEWLGKNNQEAKGEGTSASAGLNGSASTNGLVEDGSPTSTRSGRALHGRSTKAKGKEPECVPGVTYPRIVVDEDEFELVMGLFEKFTEDKFPFIHLALDAFPPFADYESFFEAPLPPATFANYLVPASVPPPERLVLVAKVVYPYWKERKVEREGKRIAPQLDCDETQEETSYICFRRRDVKPLRRTRASSTAYTDKLVRLRGELQTGLDLAKMVLEREQLKTEMTGAAQGVWQARCALAEEWRNGNAESAGAALGADEALLFDRERAPKKPRVEGLGRIVLGLNRRPSNAQSGSGTPSGDAQSPLTAHLDLGSLSSLSPLAYVAVQSKVHDRYKDIELNVEREMASMRSRDSAWEDLVDMPYQAPPMSQSDKLFKPCPPPPRGWASPLPSPRHDSASPLLGDGTSNSGEPMHLPSEHSSVLPSSPGPDVALSSRPMVSRSSRCASLPATERIPRSLRLRSGRGGRLHLDRRLHVHRPSPLLRGSTSHFSSPSARQREKEEEERWERRDWRPHREWSSEKGKGKSAPGQEYWTHESIYEEAPSNLGKRKSREPNGDEVVGFEHSGYGLGLDTDVQWEKGPMKVQCRSDLRLQGTRESGKELSERVLWRADGRTAEDVERARRVEERWRYDSEVMQEEEDRILLDDFQPKFLRTMVTLLDAKDHEMVKTDTRQLAPRPIPDASPKHVQPAARVMDPERIRPAQLNIQRISQPVVQPVSPSNQHPHPNTVPNTTPLAASLPQQQQLSVQQQRADEQIRQMSRQPPSESPTTAVTPQPAQRISLAQHSPTTPSPSQANGSPLKSATFTNNLEGDNGATVRVSSAMRPKPHTPGLQQPSHPQQTLGVNGFQNMNGGFAANQHQAQNQNLALHPGHAHGLNPQQYAALRNVFAERVTGAQQQQPGRPQMPMQLPIPMNGAVGNANINLQMGPGNLNLKIPQSRAAQLRMNGNVTGDMNGVVGVGGSPAPLHASPQQPNGNGSPVPFTRTAPTNGQFMAPAHGRVSPHLLGRASPLGHATPHHHSNLIPLHPSAPPHPTPTLAHQQVVGGAGQGHGYS